MQIKLINTTKNSLELNITFGIIFLISFFFFFNVFMKINNKIIKKYIIHFNRNVYGFLAPICILRVLYINKIG